MLRGPLQCKTKPWEGWPVRFPASAARSTPKAVESFGRKLDCNLIDGLEDVLWSLSCPGKPTIVLYSATELCLDDTTHVCVRACVPSPFLTGPTVSRSVSLLPGDPSGHRHIMCFLGGSYIQQPPSSASGLSFLSSPQTCSLGTPSPRTLP